MAVGGRCWQTVQVTDCPRIGVFVCIFGAYPGSELVVANTLAKWKKLEPNEINLSQGFSQKVVSTSCFVFNSLPARGNICCLLITLANSLDPVQARQHVGPDLDPNCLTPGGIEKIQHPKSKIWHINKV